MDQLHSNKSKYFGCLVLFGLPLNWQIYPRAALWGRLSALSDKYPPSFRCQLRQRYPEWKIRYIVFMCWLNAQCRTLLPSSPHCDPSLIVAWSFSKNVELKVFEVWWCGRDGRWAVSGSPTVWFSAQNFSFIGTSISILAWKFSLWLFFNLSNRKARGSVSWFTFSAKFYFESENNLRYETRNMISLVLIPFKLWMKSGWLEFESQKSSWVLEDLPK